MELTLNLPDELAHRLPRHEDQLALVLHLGLQVLQAQGEVAEGDLPPGWRTALVEVLQGRRDSAAGPPTVAELLAYHRDELEPSAAEDLLERLILHPQAARDLLDLIEFASPQVSAAQPTSQAPAPAPPPSPALQAFRTRVTRLAEEESTAFAAPGSGEEPQGPTATATVPARVLPFPQGSYRILAWAATLLLALGTGWMLGLPRAGTGVEQAAVFEVATSRGVRAFPLSRAGQEVLIVLPSTESAHSGQGTLRVSGPEGEVIYEEDFRLRGDPWSRLYVRLPRARLTVGTYRIEISRDPPADRGGEYWFTLEDPPTP